MKHLLGKLAASAVMTMAIAATAQAQTVLRYSNFVPPGHPVRTKILDPWVVEVEKATAGRVKFDMLPKVVGTVAGQYDVVRDGLADVAVVVPGYSPGKFVFTEIIEVPFIGDRAEFVSPAFYNVYAKNFLSFGEFRGTHLLSIFNTSPQHLFTAKKRVQSVDDFKGLKLRTNSTSTSRAVGNLGGVAVIKPVTEMYELVSGGLVDGALFNPSDHKSFNLTKLLPVATLIPGGVSASAVALVINEAKWNAISASDRDLIMAVSGAHLAKVAGKAYDEGAQEAINEFRAGGGVVDTMPAAAVAAIRERVLPIETDWVERAKQKGMSDPAGALKTLRTDGAGPAGR
ncbi:TRAP transporter substrate-binding protein [Hydrogenophaga sp.]|uniref:TRAP transporter substrate-binding protein n=1 Tax=Hydrogenophaga sp. TaxID=1904254 RepID=UPI00261E583C|nr:TRAP transporter substrate-binding protein [Hydrogenophaga sp.]MCW5653894.1 TRAP transporter substrate-binding protein [Hydrogenophaga sp.]